MQKEISMLGVMGEKKLSYLLAEELGELAHALHKFIRLHDDPDVQIDADMTEVCNSIVEEYTDVVMCAEELYSFRLADYINYVPNFDYEALAFSSKELIISTIYDVASFLTIDDGVFGKEYTTDVVTRRLRTIYEYMDKARVFPDKAWKAFKTKRFRERIEAAERRKSNEV